MVVRALLLGVGIPVAVLALVWLGRFLQGVVKGRRADMAAGKATSVVFSIVGAVIGLLFMAFTTGADVIDVVTMGVASSPLAASNFATGLIGAGALAGIIDLTAVGYVVIVTAVVGTVIVITEVR